MGLNETTRHDAAVASCPMQEKKPDVETMSFRYPASWDARIEKALEKLGYSMSRAQFFRKAIVNELKRTER